MLSEGRSITQSETGEICVWHTVMEVVDGSGMLLEWGGSEDPENRERQTSVFALTIAKLSWQTLLKTPGMGVEPRITCMDTNMDRLPAGSKTVPLHCVPQWQKQSRQRIFLFLSPAYVWCLEKFAALTWPLVIVVNNASGCFSEVTKIRAKILFTVQWHSVELAGSLASSLKTSGAGCC